MSFGSQVQAKEHSVKDLKALIWSSPYSWSLKLFVFDFKVPDSMNFIYDSSRRGTAAQVFVNTGNIGENGISGGEFGFVILKDDCFSV